MYGRINVKIVLKIFPNVIALEASFTYACEMDLCVVVVKIPSELGHSV